MKSNNKISIRQIVIIFIISIASPVIRVIPRYTSEIAGSASWVMPIFATLMFLGLLFILNAIIGKDNEKSLEDVFCDVFGKFIGKIINIIYFIWIIVIIATYLRYFADRLTSSIFVSTSNKFFMLTMLMIVYYVTRNELKIFARYLEFVMLIFTIFLIVTFAIAIPEIKLTNLLPVTTNDTVDVLKSTIPFMGILSYITFMFFFGDQISNKQEFKNHFAKMSIIVLITSIMIILVTVGYFGAKLTSEMNLPFFAFFKNIEILDIIERVESLLITFWIVTDFAIITTFTFIAMKFIKKIFNVNSAKHLITPVLFFSYILGLYLATNLFEMADYSKYIFLPVNIVLGIGFPILLLIVGKIRKKI